MPLMQEVLDKCTIKTETFPYLLPTKYSYAFDGMVFDQRKEKIWAYAWGRYKSSLGMYRIDLTSNHIATLRDGEYSGYH